MKLDAKAFSFVKVVERFLDAVKVNISSKKILIAVSGGVDSCVLLDVLWQCKEQYHLNLAVCHVNHGLRGNESNEDEKFVIRRTRDYDLPLTVRRFEEHEIADVLAGNVEEQARDLRYKLLAHTAEELNYDYIATGHTKSDQAETVLHRILRSSGLSGLAGILPVCTFHNQTVIRPLLCLTRDEVVEYAQCLQLPYCHDSMNDDIQFTRVNIRKNLLPNLKEDYNPNMEESLFRLAAVCRDEDEFWEQHVRSILNITGNGTSESPAKRSLFLQRSTAEQKRLLRYMFQNSGIEPNYVKIEDSLNMLRNQKPQTEMNLQDGLKIIRRYDLFYIGKVMPTEQIPIQVELNIPGKTVIPSLQVEIETEWSAKNVIKMKKQSKWQISINFQSVKNRLFIRTRLEGDSIQPLGMKGKKKLKKIFQEHEIPLEDRQTLPILCDQDEIVWIPGCCESEKYKVTSNTNKILQISIYSINSKNEIHIG